MATTTNYSWSTPDNTAYVKDGASAIRTLGSSVDTTLYTALGGAYPGMRLVKKQTIGTGVSSIVVSDAFSATYENYKIIVSGGATNVGNLGIDMQLGSTITGYNFILDYDGYSGGASRATVKGGNTSQWNYVGSGETTGLSVIAEVQSPFLSKNTSFSSPYYSFTNRGENGGFLNNTTSYTAFTLTIAGGNATGGTIYVYGYGTS